MIHATAIVDAHADLAADVEVGPYSLIGPDVVLGEGCVVGPHVVIRGPTRIGKRNRFFQFSSVGEDCQDKKYQGEPTRLEMGDDNIVRECVTIHRGTVQDQGVTRIGSNNLLMAYVHVAHDCVLADDCVFANNASVAGHVHVGRGVILGGMTGVHQFCHIGDYAMTAGCTLVLKDIPAYVMVSGNPGQAHGMNYEGMKRRGWSHATINSLRHAYKTVFREGRTLEDALSVLDGEQAACPELAPFIASLKASTRGITR